MMKTGNIAALILLNAVFLACLSCEGIATLFHGPKPADPPPVYTVTFNGNGAEGEAPAAQTVLADTVISLPDKGSLTSNGNIFIGWNENVAGGGTTYAAGSSVKVTSPIVFFAQWLDSSTPQYTITFNANGATSGTPPVPITAYSRASITIPNQGTLSYSGKTFNGWNTRTDGLGTNYTAGSSLSVTANITLYAKWGNLEGTPSPLTPQGTTLAEKFAWIANRSDSNVVYDIAITQNESLETTTVSSRGQNVTINLRSASPDDIKTISLSSSRGYLFKIQSILDVGGSGAITFKIKDIILRGKSTNNSALISIHNSILEIGDGAEITGNINSAVLSEYGGGIYVSDGTVNIFGGKIHGNKAGYGGGIYLYMGAVNMYGGIISGNTATYSGGGAYIGIIEQRFTKSGFVTGTSSGIIYGLGAEAGLANTASSGDAVYYDGPTKKKRNTTLDQFDEISTENLSAGWE